MGGGPTSAQEQVPALLPLSFGGLNGKSNYFFLGFLTVFPCASFATSSSLGRPTQSGHSGPEYSARHLLHIFIIMPPFIYVNNASRFALASVPGVNIAQRIVLKLELSVRGTTPMPRSATSVSLLAALRARYSVKSAL